MDLNASLKKLIERRKEIEIARQNINLKGAMKKSSIISPYIYLSDERLINSPANKKCHAKCCSKQNINRQRQFRTDTRKVSSDEIFSDHKGKCPRGRKKRKSVLTIPSFNTGKQYELRSRPGKRDVTHLAGGNFNDDGVKVIYDHETRLHSITKSKLQRRTNMEREPVICRMKRESEKEIMRTGLRSNKIPREKITINKSAPRPASNTNYLYQQHDQKREKTLVLNRRADDGDNGRKRGRKRWRRRRDERKDAKHIVATNNGLPIGSRADVEMWRRRVCEPAEGSTGTSVSPAHVLYRRGTCDEERSSVERAAGTDSPIETQVAAVCKQSRAVGCMSMESSTLGDLSDIDKFGNMRYQTKYSQNLRNINRIPDNLCHLSKISKVMGKNANHQVKPEINPLILSGTPHLLTPREGTNKTHYNVPYKLSKETNILPSTIRNRTMPFNKGRPNVIAKPLQPTAEKKFQYEGITITLPLVIMEENELSSTIHVPDYDAPQFCNVKQVWPFMKKWEYDWEKVSTQNVLRKRFDRARSLNFFREKMESLRDKSGPWYGKMRLGHNIQELDESDKKNTSTKATIALLRRKSSSVNSDNKSETKAAKLASKKSSTVRMSNSVKAESKDSLDDASSSSELSKSTIRHKLSDDLLEENTSNEREPIITRKQQKAKFMNDPKTISADRSDEGDVTPTPKSVKLQESTNNYPKANIKSDNFKVTSESKHIIIENPSKNYEISFEILESLSEETRTTNSSISVEISYEGLGSSQSVVMTTNKLELLSPNTKSICSPVTQDLSSQSCCWTSKTIDTLEFTPEASDDSCGKVTRKISSIANINLDLISLLKPDKIDKLSDCGDQKETFPVLSSKMSCIIDPYTFMFPMQSMMNMLSRDNRNKTFSGTSSKFSVKPMGNHSECAIKKKIRNVNTIRRKYDKPIKNKVVKLASLPCCTPYINKDNHNTTITKTFDTRFGTSQGKQSTNMFSSHELTEIIFNSLKRYEFATLPNNQTDVKGNSVITKKSLFISREILKRVNPVVPEILKSYPRLNDRNNLRITLSENKEMQCDKTLEMKTAYGENLKDDSEIKHGEIITEQATAERESQLNANECVNINEIHSAVYDLTYTIRNEIDSIFPTEICSTPEISQNNVIPEDMKTKQKSRCPFKNLRRKWRERRRILDKISPKETYCDRGDSKNISDVREFMLADIKNTADFFRIIGMERDCAVLIAYEGLSEKLVKAVEELKRWTARLTRPQALLTFVLSCRAGEYPTLLREIATGELSTGAELEQKIQLIDEAIQVAKEERMKESALKSSEFYGTVVEKLCLVAGNEALNNGTSLSPEAENLLKLIAQRKLEPQIEFLRQLARYVGRGLFAS